MVDFGGSFFSTSIEISLKKHPLKLAHELFSLSSAFPVSMTWLRMSKIFFHDELFEVAYSWIINIHARSGA